MVSMKHAEPMENSRKSFIQFVRNYLHPPNQACTCQLIFKRRKVQLEMKTTLALIAGKKQIHPPNCRDVQKSYMYTDALKLFILLLTQELITLIKWFWSLRYHAESAIFSTPLNRHNSKRKVLILFPLYIWEKSGIKPKWCDSRVPALRLLDYSATAALLQAPPQAVI